MAGSGVEKVSGGLRALAVLVALVLLFGVAVMVVIVLNPDNIPLCGDVASGDAALGPELECFDTSRTAYDVARAFAGAAAIVGLIAAALGIYVGTTGKRGALMLKATGLALLLGVVTVLIG